MSDDEQATLIGKAVREYQDAKKNRACLYVKASQMSRELAKLAGILSVAGGGGVLDNFDLDRHPNRDELQAFWKEWPLVNRRYHDAERDLKTLGVDL